MPLLVIILEMKLLQADYSQNKTLDGCFYMARFMGCEAVFPCFVSPNNGDKVLVLTEFRAF